MGALYQQQARVVLLVFRNPRNLLPLTWVNARTPLVYSLRRDDALQGRLSVISYLKQGERAMTMLKVVEVLAESEKGWEDAAQVAVTNASKTVRNIRSIYIKNHEAKVENGKITMYRINAKISFTLD
jgi:dodecin